MSFEIRLSEADLREMPQDLRNELLKWYFEREATAGNSPQSTAGGYEAAVTSLPVEPRREESGRVSFPELVRASILKPGTELVCRALSRQKRKGSEPYIDAGKIQEDGSVEYAGRRYDVPSKLAVAAVNNNGGNTKALNGYDYLLVRTTEGLVPLQELREQFLQQITQIHPLTGAQH